jgi:MoxR-like ATPase
VLCQALHQVDLDGARPALANAIRQLRQAGIQLSDRRIVKAQRLIAAATVLAGRTQATQGDLWPILYVLPTKESQHSAREVLRDLLAHSTHPNLLSAVEQATLQPMSRVTRLLESAQGCIARTDGERNAEAEALLREIDANFSIDTLPAILAPWRVKLVAVLNVAA